MSGGELHIAACIAYVKACDGARVARLVERRSLAEVPRRDDLKGRMVLLIERETSAGVLDAIDAIRSLPGVLAVHLAYQHAEPRAELEKPI